MAQLEDHMMAMGLVCDKAAIAAQEWIGRGDEKAADQACVNSMRTSLNAMGIDGKIVIGEGERDEAPMLYIGEKVGRGGMAVDIALDPLEGTTLCAHNRPDSLCLLAMGEKGNILHAPDVYMQKIALSADVPIDGLYMDAPVGDLLSYIAHHLDKPISRLRVCMLKRERHDETIAAIWQTGAQLQLIDDGDVQAAIATAIRPATSDLYLGIGGAPEGVLAAAALRCLGGHFLGRLIVDSDAKRTRAEKFGIKDINKIYRGDELAKGPVIFCASGVTDGVMLNAPRIYQGQYTVNSLIASNTPQRQLLLKTTYAKAP